MYASKGSAVLFGIDRPSFLLSAGHVLEETRDGRVLSMGIGSRVRQVAGRFLAAPSGPGELDVAICVFSNWADPPAPDVNWVRPAEVQKAAAPVSDAPHVAIGFPHTKQRSQPRNGVLDLNAMIHWGKGRASADVARFGLDSASHLLMDFEKNDVLGPGGATVSADPYGMSGGGVWSAPAPLTAAWELAAIAIEWRREREKALLGTRVQHVLSAFAVHSSAFAALLEPFVESAPAA